MRTVVFALLVACGNDKSPPGPIQELPANKPEPAGSGGTLASRLATGSGSSTRPPADKTPVKFVAGECTRKNADVAIHGACEYKCAQRDPVACWVAAKNYYGGHGVKLDPAKSLMFALKSCELDHGAGCALASTLYTGFKDAAQADPAKSEETGRKAYALFEKECEAADPSACITHAYWLSGKVMGGIKWLTPDETKAAEEYKHGFELREKACENREGDQCEALALDYAVGGDGLEKNAKKAFELHTKGCAALHATSCYELASEVKDDKQQTSLYEKACDQGLAKACQHLAILEGSQPTRQARLYDKACKLGEGQPCVTLGEDAAKRGDQAKARELFERACELGNDTGCSMARQLPK